MTDYPKTFIDHLTAMQGHNRKGLAELRRSLGFPPGTYVPAFPYVERFVSAGRKENDPSRLALYVIAGLFALNPRQSATSLAGAFGQLCRREEGDGVEKRFIALLGADPENLRTYLRQVLSLLGSRELGVDYAALYWDTRHWIDPNTNPEKRDQIRQRWARDFYGVLARLGEEATGAEGNTETTATKEKTV